MTKPIPDGFHSLTPHIVVTDGAQAIELYKKAFGAQELSRFMTPDGKTVMHAQLKIGGSLLMLSAERPFAQKPRRHERLSTYLPRGCRRRV